MRCLLCFTDNLPPDTVKCPKCRQMFAQMLRDTLPAGYALDNGQYHIEYPVGRGGFGITYRAIETARGKPVAVKEFFVRELMERNLTTGAVSVSPEDKERVDRVQDRFQREGRTLLRVQHPNVVRILDLFNQNETSYLVMEYLQGQTLRSRMTNERQAEDGTTRWYSRALPPDEAHHIMEGLVAAVHEAKIYHLDLKPANILIEPDGRVVLIDFGAARHQVGTGRTVPSYTANYAPPEVMTGKSIGPESDIFEAGMLLYEMLTGTLPPNASARMFENPEAARWQPDGVAEPWRSLVTSALHLEPEKRPKDVAAWWRSAFAEPFYSAPETKADRFAPEVEPMDQTIRERVTLPPSLMEAIAAPPAPSSAGLGFEKMESAGMSTNDNNNAAPPPRNNTNNTNHNNSAPPQGFDPDDDRTMNMRVPSSPVPPMASRMNTPPEAVRMPATPSYEEDNDRTVSIRDFAKNASAGQHIGGGTGTATGGQPTNPNANSGMQFGPPKAEKDGMNSTTRAILIGSILLVIVILAFFLIKGGR